MIAIYSKRLVLRGPTLEDATNLNRLDRSSEVRQYLDMPVAPSMNDSEEQVRRWINDYPADSPRGYWIAEAGGDFTGWFHLRPSRDTGELELGYRLLPEVWKQGLATEGSLALLQLARDEGEAFVIARTLAENAASRRVMEKLWMTLTREFLYDNRLPAVEYRIDLSDVSSSGGERN